jgi:type VI secretion system protein
MKERLLERLTSKEAPHLVAGRSTTSIFIESIVHHLNGLLNTRRGSVQTDENYGMPDLSNIAGSLAVGYSEMIQAEIVSQVVRYENRLMSPKIASVDETQEIITLKYELLGNIDINNETMKPSRLSLYLRVNSAGRIGIEINHVS